MSDLLREEGFSLQGNAKTIEGARHPDRDAQFRYINEQVKAQAARSSSGQGSPVADRLVAWLYDTPVAVLMPGAGETARCWFRAGLG